MPGGSSRTRRVRLDVLMVERGLAATRSQAQLLVREGHVRVDAERCMQPGERISEGRRIEVEHAPRFASRGGEKLEAALVEFGIGVGGLVCAEVGASPGGGTGKPPPRQGGEG